MADVNTLLGENMIILIESDTVPGTYAFDCILNGERGVTYNVETKEFTVPDCDNPSAPGWKLVHKEGLSLSVTAGGLLHTTSYERWHNWFTSDAAKNLRITNNVSAVLGGGYLSGAFKLTGFEGSADGRKDFVKISATMMSHGAIGWVDAV